MENNSPEKEKKFKVEDKLLSVEIPKEVPKHSHNGLDSDLIKLTDVIKLRLPKDNGSNYNYHSMPFFDGSARIGWPGEFAPGLSTTTITDSLGNIHIGVDPDSITDVNLFLQKVQDQLLEVVLRQEPLTRILIQNGFASYIQNPSSNNFYPLYTYFDR